MLLNDFSTLVLCSKHRIFKYVGKDKTDKIHRSYVEGNIDNPFLTYDENFIYFRYESLVTENKS